MPPLHLPYISPTPPLHLPYISPTSPLHLRYISQVLAGVAGLVLIKAAALFVGAAGSA